MRTWYEEEIPLKDSPPGVIIILRGVINPVCATMPLIEIELLETSEDPDAEDNLKSLYQHNPTVGHHEFSLDDVLAKYAPKIKKWREKLSRMTYEDVSKL